MHGLFVTGTDTAVGKTWTMCALLQAGQAAGLRMGAYKPVCSGAETDAQGREFWSDIEALHAALGARFPRERIGPQCFQAPLAPPAAAMLEGRQVDQPLLLAGAHTWRADCDLLLVEGAGGWHCPLTKAHTFADFASELDFPVLVVAANRLGVINHTLLTLESIQRRGLQLAGVVLTDVTPQGDQSAQGNGDLLMQYAEIPWLGRIGHGERVVQTRRGPMAGVDLWKLAVGD